MLMKQGKENAAKASRPRPRTNSVEFIEAGKKPSEEKKAEEPPVRPSVKNIQIVNAL